MNEQPGSDREHGVSLVERLRDQFGAEVDPGISLAPASKFKELEPTGDGQRMHSSGVLSRLESRGSLATRYRLDGEIARGGMGAILEVWDEDLRRHLAMKVALSTAGEGSSSKPENLDARVLARFLEEAQVTGQLEHPGIVPVHELGLDKNGHLYFTMPLIRGRDLEAIFSLVATGEEGWSTTRALGVVLKACEAMAYAHDKGVIHRDLKPANVMVGRFGEVYVMDWGLARVSGHEDRHDCRVGTDDSAESGEAEERVAPDPRADAKGESSAALYTMDGDVIGTPAYMAPEQARGQLDALDERTDVYSLGAMLYRLLTQTTPYVPRGESRNALEILTELLLGPPRSIEQLSPETPGELVAICEKAMARDAADRYANMSDLAEDLRAFMENRVVRAYETGAVAETRKWIRRNKPLAISAAAGLLALVGGMVMSLVLKDRADQNAELAEDRRVIADQSAEVAREQRELAEAQRRVADAERIKANASAELAEKNRVAAVESAELANRQARINEEVNSFLNEALFSPASNYGMGRDVRVRDVLDRASFGLSLQFQNEPAIEAQLRLTLAKSYIALAEYEKGQSNAERALVLAQTMLQETPEFEVRAMILVADAQGYLGQRAEAVETYEEAYALSVKLFGETHPAAVTSMNNLAIAYTDIADYKKAREMYEYILQVSPPEDRVGDEDVGSTVGNLGLLLRETGDLAGAEQKLLEAIEIREKPFGGKDTVLLSFKNNLALVYSDQGRLRESEKLQREVIKQQKKVLGEAHPELAKSIANLAVLYMKQGRYIKAKRTLDDAIKMSSKSLGEDHPESLRLVHNLATCYSHLDQFEEALALREPVTQKLKEIMGLRDPLTLNSMNSLAVLYLDLGRYEEAEAMYRETVELQRVALGPDHLDTLITWENLGGVLFRTERYEESREIVMQVLEARKRVLGEAHPDVGKTIYNLGMNAKYTGSIDEAIALIEEAVGMYRASYGGVHIELADFLQELGDLRLDKDDFESARENFREAIRIRRELGHDGRNVGYMLHQLGYTYFAMEEYEQAIPIFTESVENRLRSEGAEESETMVTEYLLAKCLAGVGRYDEAEPLVVKFYERQIDVLGPDHKKMKAALKFLEEIAENRNE